MSMMSELQTMISMRETTRTILAVMLAKDDAYRLWGRIRTESMNSAPPLDWWFCGVRVVVTNGRDSYLLSEQDGPIIERILF